MTGPCTGAHRVVSPDDSGIVVSVAYCGRGIVKCAILDVGISKTGAVGRSKGVGRIPRRCVPVFWAGEGDSGYTVRAVPNKRIVPENNTVSSARHHVAKHVCFVKRAVVNQKQCKESCLLDRHSGQIQPRRYYLPLA